MLGNLGLGEGLMVMVFMLAAWIVPIAIAVWFIRTLAAMAVAQRDIAGSLARMEDHLRENGNRHP